MSNSIQITNTRSDIKIHPSNGRRLTLEESLDAAHLLDDLRELGVRVEEVAHLPLGDAGAVRHPRDPGGLLGEQLGAQLAVQL